MTINCSICLNIFKEPVCLPCGHIYCSKCLSDHVNGPPNDKGLTASCPECRTNFNIFTPELACLPKQYHQFILPSVRRVYLDLTAYSALQSKLEKVEARLQVHKNHEEALARRYESISAALDAHRAGEIKARQETRTLNRQLNAHIANRQQEIDDQTARLQALDQEHKLLHSKYMKTKQRCQQLHEQVLAHEHQAEQERQAEQQREAEQAEQQNEESRVKRSAPGPSTAPRRLTMELRAMKPLPTRRVNRRTRSNSPPPVYDNHAKRPRLSEGSRRSS